MIDRFRILTYNIGFILKPVQDVIKNGITRGDIHWMKHKYKDRFFADPFLWKRDDYFYYILCEEYLFFEEKGKITLLKVDKKHLELAERVVLIEEDTHLSFPFCEENGNYIIPESVLSGQCVKYFMSRNGRSIEKKEIIFPEGLIDTIFYKDECGMQWMLTAKKNIPSSELYIYYKCGGNYQPVKHNPAVSDNRITRSAGRMFTVNGRIYRPVQDCKGRYGRQTKILEIIRLDKNGIDFKEVKTLNSFENPPFDETMHTFNVYDKVIIVDGSRDILRFPMKFFYKKMPFLFSKKDS